MSLIKNDFSEVNDAAQSLLSTETKTWIVDNLKQDLEKLMFISEQPIKFELFGMMVSAIPDLVIHPLQKKEGHQIWDFKTGSYSEDKLESYYFQLYCYAYGEYELKRCHVDQPIKLVVCFIDEKRIVEKMVSMQDVSMSSTEASHTSQQMDYSAP